MAQSSRRGSPALNNQLIAGIEDARLPNGGGIDAKIMATPGSAGNGVIELTIVTVSIETNVDVLVGDFTQPLARHAY
jgi:hypothetical protein